MLISRKLCIWNIQEFKWQWHLTSMNFSVMIRWSDNGVALQKNLAHIKTKQSKQTAQPKAHTFIIYHTIEVSEHDDGGDSGSSALTSLQHDEINTIITTERLSCGMFNISIQSSVQWCAMYLMSSSLRLLSLSLASLKQRRSHSVAIYLLLQGMLASKYPISLA